MKSKYPGYKLWPILMKSVTMQISKHYNGWCPSSKDRNRPFSIELKGWILSMENADIAETSRQVQLQEKPGKITHEQAF